jgi:hypothetical protein
MRATSRPMADPQPTDSAAPGPLSDADRDARIEQLLLSGLDQYFAGQYERAINIWTRVAFLERGHGRARAYIERARGALAERQREAEELAQAGVAAYNAGELQTARDLLTRATSTGSASDTAFLFIERLQRADAAAASEPADAETGAARDARSVPAASRRWLMTVAVCAVVAVVVLLSTLRVASWLAERPVAGAVVPAAASEPLPIVRASDVRIDRARVLLADGRAAEALRVLDPIDSTDPRWTEVEGLRADIQRVLLGLETR